ncbi:MAG: nucleotidyltransferase domain-containing protein [Spirochaetes bacterium]|nr:nucleotidyltransferase domain-containing protein [Spirochaetota bacterium]
MVNKKQIKKTRDKIVHHIKPKKIVLFGSYAEDRADEESDIDLLVISDEAGNQHEKNVRVKKLFLDRTFALDVLVYSSKEEEEMSGIKGSIINTALTKGIILYEQK